MHLSNVSQQHDFPIQLGLINRQITSGTHPMSADKKNLSKNNKISHILIVDDSNTERKYLRQILESVGYVVTEAQSGSESVELAQNNSPDLILLDIIMENGDGYQACRKLKRLEATKDIPVIMVSSKHNDVDRKWALKLGALDYILKPYTSETILQRLEEI